MAQWTAADGRRGPVENLSKAIVSEPSEDWHRLVTIGASR